MLLESWVLKLTSEELNTRLVLELWEVDADSADEELDPLWELEMGFDVEELDSGAVLEVCKFVLGIEVEEIDVRLLEV